MLEYTFLRRYAEIPNVHYAGDRAFISLPRNRLVLISLSEEGSPGGTSTQQSYYSLVVKLRERIPA
jgi:hypothetical protein